MVAHILEQSCVDSMRSLPAISLSMFNLAEDSLSRLEMHLNVSARLVVGRIGMKVAICCDGPVGKS